MRLLRTKNATGPVEITQFPSMDSDVWEVLSAARRNYVLLKKTKLATNVVLETLILMDLSAGPTISVARSSRLLHPLSLL